MTQENGEVLQYHGFEEMKRDRDALLAAARHAIGLYFYIMLTTPSRKMYNLELF